LFLMKTSPTSKSISSYQDQVHEFLMVFTEKKVKFWDDQIHQKRELLSSKK
jgi:hypothetical protein